MFIYLFFEVTPIRLLTTNIIVVTTRDILMKIMLLNIYPVNNHQIVIGINVNTIVTSSIAKYTMKSTDSFIFILSDIKFYFYIITV